MNPRRVHAKLFPGKNMRQAVGRVRVCVRSPNSQQNYKRKKNDHDSDDQDQYFSSSSGKEEVVDVDGNSTDKMMMMSNIFNISNNNNNNNNNTESSEKTGNRVMVVVDSNLEAKTALQWTLSHTVQSQDTILLLHILNPSSKQGVNPRNQRAYDLLSTMKNVCQMRRPGVQVEIIIKEGKEKGPIIVEEAKQRKISLLVLGQRKRSIMWRLKMLWAGKRTRNRVVEYCIDYAGCMTIAVRRKSRKHGGYLITTKKHKNFWLLA